MKNHNTDQCRGNNFRGNSNQNNQRNFNNSRNTQNRRYNNNNNNNNNNNRNNNNQNYRSYNNNNNRQNYNHQNNGQNNYQGRNNGYRPRNNGQNYQRGCTFCGNPYHTINNCAQHQLSQINPGNRLPALMGLQGSGHSQTPQQFPTQGQQQQALPINFNLTQ